MTIPTCRHRTAVAGGQCNCGSNWLIHSGPVQLSFCESTCPYVDRENRAALKPAPPQDDAPCKFRGPVIEIRPCDMCGGPGGKGTPTPVHLCALHGECTARKAISTVKGCLACEDRTVEWDRLTDIAPLQQRGEKPWEGCQARRPWEYSTTAMIPVFRPGPQLELVVDLLRQQTVRPYILLVDTGSPREELLALWDRFAGADDVEIHAVRAHAYRGSSEPVTVAIDVALAVCQTRWMFLTHDDVFLRRRDLLEFQQWLSARYETPVVGWQMSDRTHVCGDAWRGLVSHTATLLDLPALDGINWSMRRAHEKFGLPHIHASWPDTETGFGMLLAERGIRPLLLGEELNYQRQVTRWWDHCRSFTGAGLYSSEHRQRAEEWVAQSTAEARERIALWQANPIETPIPPAPAPRLAPQIRITPVRPLVSVIVAARNNGAYLGDTLRSALNQSVPAEVIYVDDASTDDSVATARQFPRVRVIQQSAWQGVCAARNAGCEASNGKYLLHLDGDDLLPAGYLETRAAKLERDARASFCYGPAQAFGGDFNQLWKAPEWSLKKLWAGNYVNTSTMIRADDFRAVGGWREGCGTAWDWDLFLRLGLAGFNGLYDPDAFLLYRHHAQSISVLHGLKAAEADPESRMRYLVRNQIARTQISTVLSGRLLEMFPRWLERIVENAEAYRESLDSATKFPHFGATMYNAPRLNVLHTGPREQLPAVQRAVESVGGHFSETSVTHSRWENAYQSEAERRDNVARFMARSCNQLSRTDAEMLWFVEDDILPPVNAMRDLNRAILAPQIPLYAAAGVYRNRHDPRHLIAHDWPRPEDLDSVVNFTGWPARDQLVDMTGTGCLMTFRPYAGHEFHSHIQGVPAHDWAWCMAIKGRGWSQEKIPLLADVRCRHYQTATEWV